MRRVKPAKRVKKTVVECVRAAPALKHIPPLIVEVLLSNVTGLLEFK